MADIFHCLRVSAAARDVFRAVTTKDAVFAWWRSEGPVVVRCLRIVDEKRVEWRCVDGPAEWIGTDIAFEVAPDGARTLVRLAHRNWREPTDTFAQHNTRWGRMLDAMRMHLETPEPDDVAV